VVACTASSGCATHLPTSVFSCPKGTETVRLCQTNADCTESGYTECCNFGGDGGTLQFCANSLIAFAAGATCQ
jgi:hypothetical protein